MSEVVGEAVYKIRTDESGVDFDGAGQRAGAAYGKGFGTVAKKVATGFLIGAAGLGAIGVKLLSDSVAAASDLAESTNKVQQIFGDATDSVLKFTSTSADALGQTNVQAREAASTFGIFGKAAGFSDRENAKFAKRFTKLASDLASFNNTEPQQAIEAIGAAMRGEAEPIRAYGVLLDEATLKAEAMRLGILKPVKDKAKILSYQVAVTEGQKKYNDSLKENGKNSLETLKAEANLGTARDRLQKATEGTIPPLTQQQKLLAAQSEILKQTGVAQGDFARTSDGLANQQRRLSASIEDTKAKLGTALLPVAQEVAGFLLDKGVPAAEKFADTFTDDIVPAIGDFIDDAKPVAEKWLPKIADGLRTARDVGKDAAKFVGALLDGFDNMPPWAQKVLIGGGVTAFAANKVGLTKLLGVGGDGGLLARGSRVNPMNVFVTNPGFGVGGGTRPGTPGTVIGDDGVERDPKTGRPRRRGNVPGALSTAATATILIPLAAEAGAAAANKFLGGRDADKDDRTRDEKFLEKWGQTTREAVHDAFTAAAKDRGVKPGTTLPGGHGVNIPFVNVPGVDFFSNTSGLSKAIEESTGPALVKLNDDLHDTFGVGLPALAREGLIDAGVIIDLKLAKFQDAFIRSQREKLLDFRTGVESTYHADFQFTGLDTAISAAKFQINGLFGIAFDRNRVIPGFAPPAPTPTNPPAGGGGGGGTDGGGDGGGSTTPGPQRTAGTKTEGDIIIERAEFHDWSGHDADVRRFKRLAAVGGRRTGSQVPA